MISVKFLIILPFSIPQTPNPICQCSSATEDTDFSNILYIYVLIPIIIKFNSGAKPYI